jgi:hypothetical protein
MSRADILGKSAQFLIGGFGPTITLRSAIWRLMQTSTQQIRAVLGNRPLADT